VFSERNEGTRCTRHAGFPFLDEGYEFTGRAVGPHGSYFSPQAGQIIRAIPEAGD
jgi:hypothetical protein